MIVTGDLFYGKLQNPANKKPHKNQTKKPPKFKVFDFLILDNLSQSQETLFGHSNLFFF